MLVLENNPGTDRQNVLLQELEIDAGFVQHSIVSIHGCHC